MAPDAVITDIQNHINSFNLVESHYCRKNSSKEYLETNLNLTKIHNDYEKYCHSMNFVPATNLKYRHILTLGLTQHFTCPSKISVIYVLIIVSKKEMKRLQCKKNMIDTLKTKILQEIVKKWINH